MTDDTSSFHCGAEVHLYGLHRMALPIYLLALRLSRNIGGSGRFVAHIRPLAEHFGRSERVVWRAITALKDSGFFVLTRSGYGDGIYESSEYTVLTHQEWVAQHPNRCREKLELGYGDKAATDKLGRSLYAISGGYQITFKPHRIAWYRKQGFDDLEIVEFFREWFPLHLEEQEKRVAGQRNFADGQPPKKWRKSVDYHFGEYLKRLATEPRGKRACVNV